MKAKFPFFALIGIFVFLSFPANAQITREEAIDTVLNHILTNEEIEKSNIYLCDSIVVLDSLTFYDNYKIHIPYDSNYVFFIDSLPLANWNHECFYLFMNSENGNYQTEGELKFPGNLYEEYEEISMAYPETEVVADTIPYVYDNLYEDCLAPNDNYYAVLLGGGSEPRFKRNLSHIFCALTRRYGFKKENIFVHVKGNEPTFNVDLDGDEISDFDFLSSKVEIERTFKNLAGLENTVPSIPVLEPKDLLFIFSTGHGGFELNTSPVYIAKLYYVNNTPPYHLEFIYDYEFAQYLEDINCSSISVVMQECFSGGFIDDFMDVSNSICKNRTIHTACKQAEKSWEERWVTDWKYNEFTFYWTAAAREIYPDPYYTNSGSWVEYCSTGEFPFDEFFLTVYHPDDYVPDLNGDGLIQFGEAFQYSNDFDTRSPYGFFWCPSDKIETPQYSTNISFQEDLLTLAGFAGTIENSQTIENRSYSVGGELVIRQGVELTISENASFYFINENAEIIVEPGARLILGDNVSFYGNPGNRITVNGIIEFGDDNKFIRLDDGDIGQFDGLHLMNNSAVTSINNAYFEHSNLNHNGMNLIIDHTDFIDCYSLSSYNGDVTVTNSTFIDTRIYLKTDNQNTNKTAIIQDNDFEAIYSNDINAIELNDYDNFFIENNKISGYYNGIQVIKAGGGNAGTQNISENTISGSTNNGILVYGSTASVVNNNISDCEYGIRFNNRSSVDFYGDDNAETFLETQYIHDNNSYEIFATQYSFPRTFEYNVIIDENNSGNPDDPLLYYISGENPVSQNIEYNCWGENFDYWDDLYPQVEGFYDYEPIWCPSGSGEKSAEQSLFDDALNQFELGNYSSAENKFLQLVNEYPETLLAQESLKELFRLEKFVGNDYLGLKQYFINDPIIQGNSSLQSVGEFYANNCDIELGNWQQAIEWYEYHIQHPESFEDSIFSIIDLGYLYLLMGNNGEKSITGNMPEHIPYSKYQFFAKRDYLLSLLPGELQAYDPSTDNLNGLRAGELLQNQPNPFSRESSIYFKLKKAGSVSVKGLNNLGVIKYQFNNSYMPEGTYNLSIKSDDYLSGVYFYTLEINGKKVDVKKMVILK
ncbi:MAG: right-handed parallel beta-helix repeat-containing protein [Bacteroidales bacterium]|nr:right-handed parallel beta-helix repeat-containing protein [Bacteroidales bacterium]